MSDAPVHAREKAYFIGITDQDPVAVIVNVLWKIAMMQKEKPPFLCTLIQRTWPPLALDYPPLVSILPPHASMGVSWAAHPHCPFVASVSRFFCFNRNW